MNGNHLKKTSITINEIKNTLFFYIHSSFNKYTYHIFQNKFYKYYGYEKEKRTLRIGGNGKMILK